MRTMTTALAGDGETEAQTQGTCENFPYSLKAGLPRAPGVGARCGAPGPRFAAVRALLGTPTPASAFRRRSVRSWTVM